jgi:hypothetical protein
MEIAVQLFTRIPEGWPRLVAFLVVVALYAIPTLRGQMSRRDRARPELEHLRLVLEVKKLAAEIEVLGRGRDLGDLSPANEAERLRTLLRGTDANAAGDAGLSLRERMQAALAGSIFTAMLVTMLALSGGFRPPSLGVFVARQLIVIASGTVVAGLIPAVRRRQSFGYGLLLPFAVALVIVLTQGPPPTLPGAE